MNHVVDRRIYVVVRADIPQEAWMPQACHAVAELGRKGLLRADEPHPTIVVLAADTRAEFNDVAYEAHHQGIRLAMWMEPDLGSEATAFATEPTPSTMRRPFKALRLVSRSRASKEGPHHSIDAGGTFTGSREALIQQPSSKMD